MPCRPSWMNISAPAKRDSLNCATCSDGPGSSAASFQNSASRSARSLVGARHKSGDPCDSLRKREESGRTCYFSPIRRHCHEPSLPQRRPVDPKRPKLARRSRRLKSRCGVRHFYVAHPPGPLWLNLQRNVSTLSMARSASRSGIASRPIRCPIGLAG